MGASARTAATKGARMRDPRSHGRRPIGRHTVTPTQTHGPLSARTTGATSNFYERSHGMRRLVSVFCALMLPFVGGVVSAHAKGSPPVVKPAPDPSRGRAKGVQPRALPANAPGLARQLDQASERPRTHRHATAVTGEQVAAMQATAWQSSGWTGAGV